MRSGRWGFLIAAMTALSVSAVTRVGAADLALHDAASMAGVGMFLNSGAPGLVIAVVHGDD